MKLSPFDPFFIGVGLGLWMIGVVLTLIGNESATTFFVFSDAFLVGPAIGIAIRFFNKDKDER